MVGSDAQGLARPLILTRETQASGQVPQGEICRSCYTPVLIKVLNLYQIIPSDGALEPCHSFCAFTMILPLCFVILFSVPVFSWLSAIPNTGSLPASVRAPCRAALAENITTCSEWLTYPDEWIPVESLGEICTTGCQNSLASMQVKAASACGTGSVNITTNVTSAILTPLNLATALLYRYNATCLRDTLPIAHSVFSSNFANIFEVLHTSGFCKEKLQNFTEATFCSDCYMKKTQLEIDQPLAFGGGYSLAEFNELKISCGIPTLLYPVKTTSPTATPRPT